MKRFLILCAVALSLGGCAGGLLDPNEKSILKGGQSLVATISNPATPVTIYQVKAVYAAALDIANEYRGYCYARPFKTLMADPIAGPACKQRRAIVRALDGASETAANAIEAADDFIRRNPKISAATVVREAWAAVTNFKGVINTAAASAVAVK